MFDYEGFKDWLKEEGKTERTIFTYDVNLHLYAKEFPDTEKATVQQYRSSCITRNMKPNTINVRLQTVNSYNIYLGHPERTVRFVKRQNKFFIENVISNADYKYLCNCLKRDKDWDMYYVCRFLGATGARISELVTFKAESLPNRYIDIYGKGCKQRRIWIPTTLCNEAYEWKQEGLLFEYSAEQIRAKLKTLARRYGINPKVMHPHSFRHMTALNIAAKNKDISFLCDVMGHVSYDTCKIYLQRSSQEMQKMVDHIVTW